MKKKQHDADIFYYLRKTMRIMRLSLFLIVISTAMAFSATSYSQSTKLSLDLNNATVKEVIKAIENQSEFLFFYQEKHVDLNRQVTLNATGQDVETILNQLFAGTDNIYVINDRQIVIGVAPRRELERQAVRLSENVQPVIDQPQQKEVTGKVTDTDGLPLPGVSVIVKGTTIGTVTNNDGEFSLNIPLNAEILQFSFVGMRTQEIPVDNQTTINVTMEEDVFGIEEVVAIGYGTMKKRDLTGSVSSLSLADIENKAATNPSELMLGTIAGVNYNLSSSAKPGESMDIRGITSISASNQPLLVVDGVIYYGNLADINPIDIESIDVMKDASSSAVFGAKAASGVILITTKSGKSGTPKIQFDLKAGVASLIRHQRPFNADEYLEARKWANMSGFPDADPYYYYDPRNLPTEIDVETWLGYDGIADGDPLDVWLNRLNLQTIEKENFFAGKTINWYDKVFQTALKQDYNVSISGASDLVKYYWSLGSAVNDHIVVNESYKNIRSRLNLSVNVTDYLEVGLNSHFSTDDDGDRPVSWERAIDDSPYGEMYEPDGRIKWYPHDDNQAQNPFENTEYDVSNKTQTLMGNLSAKLKLPWGFEYRLNYSNRWRWGRAYEYRPTTTRSGNSSNGYASRQETNLYQWQIDNILQWKKTLAEIHQFDLTLLYNAEQTQSFVSNSENSNFSISEALSYNGIHLGSVPLVSASDYYETGMAMMARLNYSLMDRYLLTLSYRRDGYSAFGQANPTADFPSAAFAWRIFDEPFMKNQNWLDNLKLRFSWGINGNRDVGRYSALSRLGQSAYIIDGQTAITLYPQNLPNKELKWERTEALNLGLDFGIFNNNLTAEIDVYQMSTKDLLLDRALPNITGYESVIANLGEIQNKGLEATISSVNISNRNFNWKSRFIFSTNRNTIKHLYGDMVDILDEEGNVIGQREDDDIKNGWYIGHALDEIYEYKVDGVWQLDEAEQAKTYGLFPGDFKVLDVDGDGFFTPEKDKVWIGYKRPKYRLSLNNSFELFNSIDISFLLRSYLGHVGRNNVLKNRDYHDRTNNYDLPFWTPDNPTNQYTRIWSTLPSVSYNVYRSKSFVRLQNLTFAYRFSKNLTNKLGITNARVYLNFDNLISIDSWEYWDPETNDPTPMISTLGISLTL